MLPLLLGMGHNSCCRVAGGGRPREDVDLGGHACPAYAVHWTEATQQKRQHSEADRVLENDVMGCGDAQVVKEAVARKRHLQH